MHAWEWQVHACVASRLPRAEQAWVYARSVVQGSEALSGTRTKKAIRRWPILGQLSRIISPAASAAKKVVRCVRTGADSGGR
jgi:hypothetical protein